MTENIEELSDVKCVMCNRTIGQRTRNLLIQFGMRTKFNKSARIFCPFIGCGVEQGFFVNRENNLRPTSADSQFLLTKPIS